MTSVTKTSGSMKNEAKNNVISSIEDDAYDMKKCAEWINIHSLEKVCLQFPDNLLSDSVKIASHIERSINKNVYILGDTTSGSCCVDEIAAEHVNADGIIHYGHTCLNPTVRIPVFHVLPRKKIDVNYFLRKFKEVFQDHTERILLFYDIAYAYIIEHIFNELKHMYEHFIISTLNCTSNVPFTDTQSNLSQCVNVLGRTCTLEEGFKTTDYKTVFLGESGKTFITLAMSISTNKWYYFENDIIPFDALNIPWLKRRRFLIEKLKDAQVIGIVVATLAIKDYLKMISAIKSTLKIKNKKTYILSIGKINPAKLANFPEVDAFVAITCPENEIFDSKDFLRPILMPYEVDLAFNSSREFSTEYCLDFRQILPGGTNYIEFKPSMDSDVSLISGTVRNLQNNISNTNKMNALSLNTTGTVAIGKAGAEFLCNRSWKGVEQRLGENLVQPAKLGRCGISSHYENEPPLEKENDTKFEE